MLLAGASRTRWGTIPLPFDLTVLNAAGCFINASGDVQISTMTTALGGVSMRIGVPKSNALLGATIYFQWFHFNPRANGLGLLSTRGATATVGYQ